MAQSKRRVRFTGILQGQGQQATCTVEATEVSVPGLPPAYAKYLVVSVSKVLPEGTYTLTANGETHNLRYQGGYWLAAP